MLKIVKCLHFVCKQYKVGIRANFFIYSNVNGGEIIMADDKTMTVDLLLWGNQVNNDYFINF